MSWISKRWKIQGIPPLNISQYVAERIKKQKKQKNKISIVKKWKKSVKNPRTSILVPYGMPYTRLYGWYQEFARIAQCPGREASLQQALALPQEVRSRREALPTSTLHEIVVVVVVVSYIRISDIYWSKSKSFFPLIDVAASKQLHRYLY